MSEQSVNRHRKVRQLGLVTAVCIVIANIIGTGIFTTTGFLAEELGSPMPILIGWIIGGVIALCGALTYAELAVNMPKNGGEYFYLSRLYHPAVGFISGWASLFAGFAAPIAAAAVAFGQYFQAILPGISPSLISVILLIVFTLLHLLNARFGSAVQNVFTILKVTLIVGVILIVLFIPKERSYLHIIENDWQIVFSSEFAVALIFIMFSYSGWNAAAYIGGEVKDPSTILPIALITGTAAVSLMYTGLNIFYLSYVPLEAVEGQVEVAHIAATAVVGETGARFMTIIILLALVTSVSSMTMAGSRVYQAMGEDHPFFSWLARRTKTRSPANAILLQSTISLFLILTLTFDSILYYVGFTLSLFAGLTVFGIFILRKRGWSKNRYRTWGYPLTPLLFLGVTFWMVLYTFLDRTTESLIGLSTLGIGFLVYLMFGRRTKMREK